MTRLLLRLAAYSLVGIAAPVAFIHFPLAAFICALAFGLHWWGQP